MNRLGDRIVLIVGVAVIVGCFAIPLLGTLALLAPFIGAALVANRVWPDRAVGR